MSNYTIREIHDKFVDLVKREKLYNINMRDIKIWQYSQFEVFNLILNKRRSFEQAHSRLDIYQFLLRVPYLLYYSFIKTPFLAREKSEILIFNHPRKVLKENQYIDIYTQYYIEQLDKLGYNGKYKILEKPYLGTHYGKKRSDVYYLDDLRLYSYFKRFFGFGKAKLTREESDIADKITNQIFDEFGVKIDVKSLFEKNISRFKINFQYFDKLLAKNSTKLIFIVVSYSYMELISAAKKRNIETVEIQHGVITPYSVAYNFPGYSSGIEYFPDSMLMFGDFWRNGVDFPISKDSLIIGGFPFLDDQLEKYSQYKKRPNTILFVSQGTIGKKLFAIALEVAKKMPEYTIIFKLHPGELGIWKQNYLESSTATLPDNLQVVDKKEISLYSLFAICDKVVGVYSTALYEALTFGNKCILMNLPGVEYMDKLIGEKNVYLANGSDDIVNFVQSNGPIEDNNQQDFNYYFSKNKFRSALQRILTKE